jgi:hypothetical protein
MANVAYGGMGNAGAVALILQALKLDILYGVKVLTNSAGFQILLALSINLTGFGCAGILRRFLVYPPVMLRPVNFWRKIPVILSGGVMWATYNFAMSGLQWWLVHRQLLHQAEILGVVENICLRDDLCDCLPTTIKIISPQFYCVVILDARDIHKTMH